MCFCFEALKSRGFRADGRLVNMSELPSPKKGTVARNCFTYHQFRASACYVGREEGACALFVQKSSQKYEN